MAKYRCLACGYIFDEEKEGRPFSELGACPMCGSPVTLFELVEEEEETPAAAEAPQEDDPLAYDPATYRVDPSIPHLDDIHEMAVTGETIHAAMATTLPMPGWNDVLLLGAQLDPMPLDEHAPVDTQTVIGPNADKPLVIDSPVYVSHMSFGALSREAKVALAKGTAMAGTAMCSGEGGIIPEEMEVASKYIFEYVANRYSATPENLKRADAIEIKIGQGTKPGMGGHLPAGKVTPEIAEVRGKPLGEDIQAPSRFPGIDSADDLKRLVDQLRTESEGRPIGIKIAAGHIESDLAFCLAAEPDFVTVDGRGGATGSSPKLLRDAASVPTVFALARARKYLDSVESNVSLVITGGLRVSTDFAKALALGADAVAVATGALMALGCMQYRICGSDKCPAGIATQDPELRPRLDGDVAAQRVANYLNVSKAELETIARITGHERLHDLSLADIVTTSRDIADWAGVAHV